jgi:peptide/nickel transport system ATP-binding protein
MPDLDMSGRANASRWTARCPIADHPAIRAAPFHPRCPLANDRCKRERPELKPAGDAMVACHAVEEGRDDAMPMPAIARDAA